MGTTKIDEFPSTRKQWIGENGKPMQFDLGELVWLVDDMMDRAGPCQPVNIDAAVLRSLVMIIKKLVYDVELLKLELHELRKGDSTASQATS